MEFAEIIFYSAALGIPALLLLTALWKGLRVLKEHERAARFRLGRFKDVLGPGVIFSFPLIDSLTVADTRTKLLAVPKQRIVTSDNATVFVDAVTYYRIADPEQLATRLRDSERAVRASTQATLRSVIGETSLENLYSKREFLNAKLRDSVNESIARWGLHVEGVEIHDVLPSESAYTVLSHKSAAEHKKLAKIKEAEGEREAAKIKAQAHAEALQSLNELSQEYGIPLSTLVFGGVGDSAASIENVKNTLGQDLSSPKAAKKPRKKKAGKAAKGKKAKRAKKKKATKKKKRSR